MKFISTYLAVLVSMGAFFGLACLAVISHTMEVILLFAFFLTVGIRFMSR